MIPEKRKFKEGSGWKGMSKSEFWWGRFFVHESCLQRGEKKRALVIFFTAFRSFQYITPAVTRKHSNNKDG